MLIHAIKILKNVIFNIWKNLTKEDPDDLDLNTVPVKKFERTSH